MQSLEVLSNLVETLTKENQHLAKVNDELADRLRESLEANAKMRLLLDEMEIENEN